jgi:hypothetical protein
MIYKIFLLLVFSFIPTIFAYSDTLITNPDNLKVFSSTDVMGTYAFNSGNQNR